MRICAITHCGLIVVLLALLNGCAATVQYVPMPDLDVEVEDPGQCRVYVVRTSPVGSSIPMGIFDGGIDGTKIGRTGPRGFLCWERPPGEFEVAGRAENVSSLDVAAEAGDVVYIQQIVRMGFFIARNKLVEMDAVDGDERVEAYSRPYDAQGGESAVRSWEAVTLLPRVGLRAPLCDGSDGYCGGHLDGRLDARIRSIEGLLFEPGGYVGGGFTAGSLVKGQWWRYGFRLGLGRAIPIPSGECRLSGGVNLKGTSMEAGSSTFLDGDFTFALDGQIDGKLRIGPRFRVTVGDMVEYRTSEGETVDLPKQLRVELRPGFALSVPAGSHVGFSFEMVFPRIYFQGRDGYDGWETNHGVTKAVFLFMGAEIRI